MTKEEVHKMAPSLKKASKLKSPFAVPENYFDNVVSEIEMQLKLENFRSANDFHTPEGFFDSIEDRVITQLKATALGNKDESQEIPADYFNTLEDKVMAKLNLDAEQTEKKGKIISLNNWKKILAPVAIAASLVLIFTLGNRQEEVTFESLAMSDLEAAVESHLLAYDSETLLDLFPEMEESLDHIEFKFSEEESLEDYLYESDLSNILYE